MIRVWGRRRGLICALSGTHSPRGCVRWLWNDQTGGTTRFPTCRAESGSKIRGTYYKEMGFSEIPNHPVEGA